MDQRKIGTLLRDLRKEKGWTQERLAETLGVTGRTVSRWETGANLPDLDLLLLLADTYQVDLRELLDGERRSERMDRELKETVEKVADYSGLEKRRLRRRMCVLFVIGLVGAVAYCILEISGALDQGNHVLNFLAGIGLGFSVGMTGVGALYTSGLLDRLKERRIDSRR